MQLGFRIIHLRKRFALAISRGVSSGSENLFVSVTADGVTGWGEMAPGIGENAVRAADGRAALTAFFTPKVAALSITEIHDRGREVLPPCVQAALDIALWDHAARRAKLPLRVLLGLPAPRAPTSITIGINRPEVVRERIPLLLAGRGIRALKIKLGAPAGIETDQAMFAQTAASAKPYGVSLRVDANGGWGVDEALVMMKWLAQRGVEYVEQPLAEGCEDELPALFARRPLPIFVDESCRFATDLPRWAHAVDGVNIKLMKCGGITGALRIMATAHAHGLQTMIGCMSESSLSISAAAALGGALDYIDLDSALNLAPDPCSGARLVDGVMMPSDRPGHGAAIIEGDVIDNDVDLDTPH